MNDTIRMEFTDNGYHRLVSSDGTATLWASYSQPTYLQGFVGVTDYYTGTGEAVLTVDAAIPLLCVGTDTKGE